MSTYNTEQGDIIRIRVDEPTLVMPEVGEPVENIPAELPVPEIEEPIVDVPVDVPTETPV